MQILTVISTLIVTFLCITQIEAFIGVEAFNSKKNYTSHCFGEGWDIGAMEKGETKRVKGVCAIAVCREDRSVQVNGCAPVAVRPPCYVTDGDLSKPFPECCFEIRCKTDINDNKL